MIQGWKISYVCKGDLGGVKCIIIPKERSQKSFCAVYYIRIYWSQKYNWCNCDSVAQGMGALVHRGGGHTGTLGTRVSSIAPINESIVGEGQLLFNEK